MRPINLVELKKIQLEILQNTADFCEKNNINYFLAWGTLIGAIRHKGIIPWDDDIDIAMPRPDYDRFIQTFNQQTSDLKVIDLSSNKKYGFPFAKVHNTKTVMNEVQYAQDQFGVYIDIFPVDGMGDVKEIKKVQRLTKLLHTKKANFTQRTFAKKIINTIGKIALLPFSTHAILERIDKIARKYPFGTTPKAAIVVLTYGLRGICDTSLFTNTIFHEFEGGQYRIPADYDILLRSVYDDYMQLPPEDKRASHHFFEAYWKD